MKVVTGEQMQAIDRTAIHELGIPSAVLMENAGLQVARAVLQKLSTELDRGVIVVCGRGNNGGDGLVAARHLAARGVEVAVLLLGRARDLKGDPAAMWTMLDGTGASRRELADPDSASWVAGGLRSAGVVVDAIFGTGLTRPAEGYPATVIQAVNDAGRPVVAVDLPSGLPSDSGFLLGPTIQADWTVTMGLPKRSLLLHPAAGRAGQVLVAEIGFPRRLLEDPDILLELLLPENLLPLDSDLPAEAHKGTQGHLLILAGSPGKTGAAILAARAALRLGTGLVTLAVPESVNPILEGALVEAMTLPLPCDSGGALGPESLERLIQVADGMSAVALGPGLGSEPGTWTLIRELLQRLELPTVVDADGLNALAGHLDGGKLPGPLVLTPHPGEMARLTGRTTADIQRDRPTVAAELARDCGAHVVLKGAGTVVADPAGGVSICPRGNPGMATGGTGDALTGMVGGLLAQGADPGQAARTGVFLHSLCGDLAARELSQRALTAQDLIDSVPDALAWMARDRSRPPDPLRMIRP